MKQTVFILICACFSVSLLAQELEEQQQIVPPLKFERRYAGTSVDAGFMFMPHYGSAFYLAPKLQFQVMPRLFVNTGISMIQYNLSPLQIKSEGLPKQNLIGTYIFAEGVYLLNERWSVNGSAMKNISPELLRRVTPYSIPSETVHFGVDYKVTPNISVGVRVGYSSSGEYNRMYNNPFFP